MSDIAIRLENISKQYRLGVVGTGTLSHDLNRWFARIRGKEDPTLKIGQSNQLAKAGGDYVWALKDINLEVKKGEILGIIGKNGAGKSTLLKLLSRVTGPTTGQIKVNGRIASLLEVGTGFHPELTGRENIFLNGAILGMRKWEIKKKLDEIVDFAGVAKYLDTPVKRYSSGMYVRLAFAVAAHLEPDILVVDEVLAVGDAEFQKKAIGKMQEVSRGGGRTVLFVSHNMASVKALCNNGILLSNGRISFSGNINNVVKNYIYTTKKQITNNSILPVFDKLKRVSLNQVSCVVNNRGSNIDLIIKIQIQTKIKQNAIGIGFAIKSESGVKTTGWCALDTNFIVKNVDKNATVFLSSKSVNQYLFFGNYFIDVWLTFPVVENLLKVEDICSFEIPFTDYYKTGRKMNQTRNGVVPLKFTFDSINK